MKILAIENEIEGITADDFKPHLEAEALKVWDLYKKGIIRELYFRGNITSSSTLTEKARPFFNFWLRLY